MIFEEKTVVGWPVLRAKKIEISTKTIVKNENDTVITGTYSPASRSGVLNGTGNN